MGKPNPPPMNAEFTLPNFPRTHRIQQAVQTRKKRNRELNLCKFKPKSRRPL